MHGRRRLILATRNPGKVREIRAGLDALGLDLIPLDGLDVPEIMETGSTFEENAAIKAVTVSRFLGEAALGEDSGLEVDALKGLPGVRSARFAGEQATDEDNNRLLLERMKGVPTGRRTCRYRCVFALAVGGRVLLTAKGVVEGRVAESPAGNGGFGYDPLFYLPESGRTAAQMTTEEKNRISHRGRALRALRKGLLRWLRGELNPPGGPKT